MENIKLLLRRLASAGYDALILVALWIVATMLLMPFTHGAIDPPLPYNLPFDLYILGISYAYLVGFWMRGGQTLGPKAWKMEIVEADGSPLTLKGASLRFVLGMVSWMTFGAGWIWLLFDRDSLAFHDRFSGTRVRRITNGITSRDT